MTDFSEMDGDSAVTRPRGHPITHGKSHSAEYTSWSSMRERCGNEKHRSFHNYGARGIKVCERWEVFANFFADMGERPSALHSLDRIDNNGNYGPGNCRWATREEQAGNKRPTKPIVYLGKTQSLKDAVRSVGGKYDTILRRVRSGWDVTTAIDTPIKAKRPNGSDRRYPRNQIK